MSVGRILTVGAIGVVATLVGYGIYRANKNAKSDQELIDRAIVNLLTDSPIARAATKDLAIPSTQITPMTLSGGDLAQTAVNADGSWHISIDVGDVQRCMDRLEPVIAHELYHVLQATKMGTPEEFITRVNTEKAVKDWEHRSFEIEAMAWEDKVRVDLRSRHPEAYRTMPASRATTNQRYKSLKG